MTKIFQLNYSTKNKGKYLRWNEAAQIDAKYFRVAFYEHYKNFYAFPYIAVVEIKKLAHIASRLADFCQIYADQIHTGMGKDDSMMGLKVKCSLLRLIFSLSVKITFSVHYI